MKHLPLFLFLTAPAFAEEGRTICYFSLNESKEYRVTKDFVAKVNRASPVPIRVKEFLTEEGSDPETAFKKMVDSGTKCDGLVISGHHYGSWDGKRAKGKLSMDFLEKLSCEPERAEWFRNINATWLQGCRTLGVGEITSDEAHQFDADFHTRRVGEVIEEDNLEQDFAGLNMEFSNALDQDNPLASRYLRLFPESKLFGWTRSAPGEKTKSWLSILFHMAQTARLLDEEKQFPESDPSADSITPKAAAEYAQAILFNLQETSAAPGCQDLATNAWLAHGGVGGLTKYSFDNDDLKSYTSLSSTGDNLLKDAREIECMLKEGLRNTDANAGKDQISMALDLIEANPSYLPYSFNTMIDLLKELRIKKRKKTTAMLVERMANMPGMLDLLNNKLTSPQVGITRKIDYYKFYKNLTGRRNSVFEQEIRDRTMKALLEPLPIPNRALRHPNRSRNLAANYRHDLFQSLVKNGLASDTMYYDLLNQASLETDVLYAMIHMVPDYAPSQAIDLIDLIVDHPSADHTLWEPLEEISDRFANSKRFLRRYEFVKTKPKKVIMKTYKLRDGSTQNLPAEGGGLW